MKNNQLTQIARFFTWGVVLCMGSIQLMAQISSPPDTTEPKTVAEAALPAAWQTDLAAFESHLKKLTAAARMPTMEEFSKRLDEQRPDKERDLQSIADGAGGVVDFKPGKDTVQFRVNQALKGQAVRWAFELGQDETSYTQVMLTLAGMPEDVGDGKDIPFLNAIAFKRHEATLPPTPLRKGQRIVLEGTIGDTQRNNDDLDSYHGATAIHYLDVIPHPIFWLGLDEVRVTRVDPTAEELAAQILSDKPRLDREAWKILEVNRQAAAAETPASQIFDSDVSTAWHALQEDGQAISLLVDMIQTQTVTGIRYQAPRDAKQAGALGSVVLYVADSRESMGEPVGTASFIHDSVEQEASFGPVTGRYFRMIANPTGVGSAGVAIAELHLLGTAVPFPETKREPPLPPLADEIERFERLYEKLEEPPAALELTPGQSKEWARVARTLSRQWYDHHRKPLYGLLNKKEYAAVSGIASRQDLSLVDDANFYAVAASPELSSDAQRAAMIAISKGMRQSRLDFLFALKRILSNPQQAHLKEIVAGADYKPVPTDAEWKDIFDGKSLDGWDGDPTYWSVEDGIITGVNTAETLIGDQSFLIYTGESEDHTPVIFGDFELMLEYRIYGHNSGVQYRGFKLPDSNRSCWRVGGYQADFDAARETVGQNLEPRNRGILAKRGESCSLDRMDDGRKSRGIATLDDPAVLAATLNDAPDWNTLHITARGNRFTHSINGVLMSKVIDNDKSQRRASGLIAIELHEGVNMKVELRRVRIRSAGAPLKE